MLVSEQPFDTLLSRSGFDPDKGRETPPEIVSLIEELDILISKIPTEDRDRVFSDKNFPEYIQQTRNLVAEAGQLACRGRVHSSSINSLLLRLAIDRGYVSFVPVGLYAFIHVTQLESFKNALIPLI